MKRKTKLIAVISGVALMLVAVIAVSCWHKRQMHTLQTELSAEYEKSKRMEERINAIKAEKASLESENLSQGGKLKTQSQTIEKLQQKAAELTAQIDDLLTVEVVEFDAAAFTEEIQNISELATVEYRYTNIGTLDATEKFSFIDWKKPFSDKTAIVSMDGVIKAGTDLSKVKVQCDEAKKVITITLPEAEILSNELFEKSFEVYEEKDSIWNPITLDDSNELRVQIKEKAQQNAIDNKVLEEAGSRAQQLIQKLIEALPNVREQYQIEFRKAI